MLAVIDVSVPRLAIIYLLLLFPLGAVLWLKLPILGSMTTAIVRMTVQLLFVGIYLQVIFDHHNPWLNLLWLAIMLVVADISIARSCGLQLSRFARPLFIALATGTAIPLLTFLYPVLARSTFLEAQYAIPISGMIMGNCMRANIIGVRNFYHSLRKSEKAYLNTLAQGATLQEGVRPYFREAVRAALSPTIATMATIGLVSLPGMMTGVILGGNDPSAAIKYQIAIMVAIFSGTAITVTSAIWLTIRTSFNTYGILDKSIFTS